MKNSYTEETISTQILVIGSGAGGAVTASALATAGHQVLIIEEGSNINTSSIATHTPEAMQLLYRNNGLSPIFGNTTIASAEGCCVGGSTEINSALWHRTPQDAIHRWTKKYQVEELSEEKLNKLFAELELELNVSFLISQNIPASSLVLKKGAEKLGYAIEEVPRAQSSENLTTSQFSPGAKRSMSRTYLPKAVKAGAKLISDCRAIRIHFKNNRITHISAIQNSQGKKVNLTIQAEVVFLCCGAIQTPLLLRASGIKHNIGNTLHIHPMLKVAALFDEKLDSHKAPLPIYQIREFYPDITLGGSVFTPGFLAMILSENWESNKTFMGSWQHMAIYYTECRSSGTGRVRVFPKTKEAFVYYKLSKQDQLNLNTGFVHLCEVLFAGGARKIFPSVYDIAELNSVSECRVFLENPILIKHMGLTSVHMFSTCPMGEDKTLCAVDSFGKVHGFQNLYISDASIIPDAPGVNPQGTIMALASRNARHFLEE